ncbi:hypothetical protein GCM10010276_85820 [Streptomyces longisporus]|uniref:Uncharacterized protein n=1 Tax=Streptomyces longisporus TaxID=1948 RepID=A0ABP6AS06_STRLO
MGPPGSGSQWHRAVPEGGGALCGGPVGARLNGGSAVYVRRLRRREDISSIEHATDGPGTGRDAARLLREVGEEAFGNVMTGRSPRESAAAVPERAGTAPATS